MRTITLLCFSAFFLAACAEEADSLNGGRDRNPGDGTDGDGKITPEALQCTEKPEGRSYTLFDGTKLDAQRLNENIGVNRVRFKPYTVMAGEYQRVLGATPPSLAKAGDSFDDPPARWYAEAVHSGVSISASFSISFEGCLAFTKTPAEFGAAPTPESAKDFCTSFSRKAWSKSASAEELAGCVDLATNKLNDEKDARRKWAYVCASVLSSSNFLTF